MKGRECEEEEEDEVEDGALGVPGRAAGVGLEGVAVGNAEGVPPGQPQRGESVNISHKRHLHPTDPYSSLSDEYAAAILTPIASAASAPRLKRNEPSNFVSNKFEQKRKKDFSETNFHKLTQPNQT